MFSPRAKRVIFLFMQGGPSHVDTFDYKPELMRGDVTGEDQGESRQLWIRWWNENKKTFEVPEKAPRLPKKVQERWDYYWGIYHKKDRGEKREDRGDDPEDDDA